MNARRILDRIIEMIFPEYVRTVKKGIEAKRTAMNALVRADRKLRDAGFKAKSINVCLNCALNEYQSGRYENVVSMLKGRM